MTLPDFSTLRFDFHKYVNYWECPKKFLKKYTREEPTVPQNGYYRIAGELVQKFFEMYSNHWRASGSDVSEGGVKDKMRPFWTALQKWNEVDWSHPMSRLSEPDLFTECVDTIVANLNELDVYADTQAELKFEVKLKSGDILVAKMDFLQKADTEEATILDGKNSGTMGKNVDPRQLLFYAIMFRFKYGRLPKRLGFLYYKFRKIEDISFTSLDVDELWKDMIRTMVHIKEAKEFPATPCAKSCRYCDYLNTCEEGTADMNSRKRGKKDYMKGVSLKNNTDGVYYLEVL